MDHTRPRSAGDDEISGGCAGSGEDSMKITLVLCLAAVSAAQNSEPGSISGAVRDAATGEPVPRAAVSLHLQNGGVAGSQADEQGQYVFDGLAAGSYRVGVAAPLE